MNNSVDNDNSSESTTLPGVADMDTLPTGIIISPLLLIINTVILSVIAVTGFFGNLAVFAAFGMNAKLRSKHFNLMLLNLTLADFGVSCIIPFTILFEQLGFWPLGVAACFFYILGDYGMTTMSALTISLISIDRCWAACWSNSYRTLNTRKRTLLCIAILWLLFLVTWLPVIISDRINHSYDAPGDCTFRTAEDRRFGIFYLTAGFPIPVTLMIVCNIKVFIAVRRSRASVQPTTRSGHSNTTSTTATITVKSTTISERKKETTLQLSDAATTSHQGTSASQQNHETTTMTPVTPVITVTPAVQRSSDVEKIFRSVCYVVGAYLILWFPVCFTQSVMAFYSVSDVLLESLIVSNIFSYSNSAVNPFLYAVGSNDFRVAFKSMFKKVTFFR